MSTNENNPTTMTNEELAQLFRNTTPETKKAVMTFLKSNTAEGGKDKTKEDAEKIIANFQQTTQEAQTEVLTNLRSYATLTAYPLDIDDVDFMLEDIKNLHAIISEYLNETLYNFILKGDYASIGAEAKRIQPFISTLNSCIWEKTVECQCIINRVSNDHRQGVVSA